MEYLVTTFQPIPEENPPNCLPGNNSGAVDRSCSGNMVGVCRILSLVTLRLQSSMGTTTLALHALVTLPLLNFWGKWTRIGGPLGGRNSATTGFQGVSWGSDPLPGCPWTPMQVGNRKTSESSPSNAPDFAVFREIAGKLIPVEGQDVTVAGAFSAFSKSVKPVKIYAEACAK